MFPFTPDLLKILDVQRDATKTASVKRGRIIPQVFHRAGAPIKSFRHSWDSACTAAGVPGRIFHDFRRTAFRNLERAGVSRSVAMKLTGHKTGAVYRRYAIVNDADLHAAGVKPAAPSVAPTGTITGTVARIGPR
jgi:integrase